MTIDYDHQAKKWKRDKPKYLSDFVGRPELLRIVWDMVMDVGPATIVELGSGEGYLTRKIADMILLYGMGKSLGRKVVGVERSKEMLRFAMNNSRNKKINSKHKLLEYVEGNVMDLVNVVGGRHIKACVGACITNYIPTDELADFYTGVAEVTSPEGGEFAFLMPHPCFCLTKDFGKAMHYEDISDYHYIGSRGKHFHATLKTTDRKTLEVGRYHSTLEDHFNGIRKAGLVVTRLEEPVVTPHLAKVQPLLEDAVGEPIYLIIAGRKLPE